MGVWALTDYRVRACALRRRAEQLKTVGSNTAVTLNLDPEFRAGGSPLRFNTKAAADLVDDYVELVCRVKWNLKLPPTDKLPVSICAYLMCIAILNGYKAGVPLFRWADRTPEDKDIAVLEFIWHAICLFASAPPAANGATAQKIAILEALYDDPLDHRRLSGLVTTFFMTCGTVAVRELD